MKSNPTHKETYARARDDPFFDGMRRGEATIGHKGRILDFQEKMTSKNINRSASERGFRHFSGSATHSPKVSVSPSDIVLEPVGRSLSGRWSKTYSPLAAFNKDLKVEADELPTASSPDGSETPVNQIGSMRSVMQKSYDVRMRQTDLSNVPFPPSAALYYYGPSPLMEVVGICQSVQKLNLYLKARRSDVSAGVPGRFLHAVLGPDSADVGSVASTIMYAFYIDQNHKSNQFCTLPIINMKRSDLDGCADLQWLLNSCHVDLSSLICIDEIDLSYYDLFGSLKLVLLNCDMIPSEQEALKGAIIEVFNCSKPDPSYSHVDSITMGQDASCCAIIAERFIQTSPEILSGRGFSRLLLAGILMDTGNLSSAQCTAKDKYMATLLIDGAGRFGCNGLYQILKYKTCGSASTKLMVGDILLKEYKKLPRTGKQDSISSRLPALNIGMSSIGMSIAQLLSHNSTSTQEIIHFQNLEKLGILMVVSGYYDPQKKFKREILVSAESVELLKNLLLFLDTQLPLKVVSQPGLKEEMRVFEVDKIISRRTIERLLDGFGFGYQ
ncbi:hypothetical protein F511_16375 [Dorcoceras hygrometricum]|uniref:DHHA2 domain-containing protein n=1 Tax=Dorcoceras hygrometricum TaxID=472368 RepID=A0A2Z7AQN7_9LAMI|nr:hypothetical protein F511_16375 [Dorcoceras hygrometricum]